jgi:hypothetical protein
MTPEISGKRIEQIGEQLSQPVDPFRDEGVMDRLRARLVCRRARTCYAFGFELSARGKLREFNVSIWRDTAQ